jgi:ABC-2 type transport system permease protein
VSSILDQITALGGLRNLLPTHYSDAWLGILSTPVQSDDIVKGTISAVAYATIFWSLAFWRFTRKDVVS